MRADEYEIHENITSIKDLQKTSINDFIKIINKKFDTLTAENKEEYSKSMMKFVPPSSNKRLHEYQIKLFNVSKMIIDDNDSDPIEILCTDEELWTKSNKEVIRLIGEKLEEFSTLKEFQDEYGLINEEEKSIKILNECFQFVDKRRVFPNMYGEMCNLNEIKYNEEISSNFFTDILDLAKEINGKDIRKILAYPHIKYHKIIHLSFGDFSKEIQDQLNDLLEHQIMNPKIYNMVHNMKMFTNNSLSSSFFDRSQQRPDEKMRQEIMKRLYAKSVQNRLREINEPTMNDLKRWPWELIQNSRDSILESNEQDKVHMLFEFSSNEVIFTHDGSPFTGTSLYALLYEFSEGKEFNKESIGRFGTGFLTTHVISKIVEVVGDVIEDGVLRGFTVTLNREGQNSKELIENLDKMENSKKHYEEPFGYTQFRYINDSNKRSEDQFKKICSFGIENLKSNLPSVLVFCPEIEYIIIKTSEGSIKYRCIYSNMPEYLINEEHYNNLNEYLNVNTRKFIAVTDEISQKDLPLSFSVRTNNIFVTGAIEVEQDDEGKFSIVSPENHEHLFCSFPLVGSKIKTPIMLNCNQFETSTERQAIFTPENSVKRESNDSTNINMNEAKFNDMILD